MRDLDEILAGQHLELPIRGKTYRIQPIGWKDELRIKHAETLVAKATETGQPLAKLPMDDEEFLRITLGDVLDQMREDNLPGMVITRAALTAHAYNTAGLAVAELVWENGPSPEALAASMQAALGSTPSSSTDEATATPTPASTSGTRRRTTTPRASRPAKQSAGRKSSSNGR